MPYDDTEALRILASARATKFPHEYEPKKVAAAERLVGAVLGVATKAGWTTGKDSQGDDIVEVRSGAGGVVWIKANSEGVHVGHTFFGQHKTVGIASLAYDPSLDEWVGTEDDREALPAPAEPPRKRNGLAVVAELLAKALVP